MDEEFQKRIDYKGKIDNISSQLCEDYNLSRFISSEIMPTGYEDFNYVIRTLKASFSLKFSEKNAVIVTAKG